MQSIMSNAQLRKELAHDAIQIIMNAIKEDGWVASNIPFPFCDKWKLCIKKGVPTTFLLKEQDAPIFYGVITPEKDDCCWVRLDLTKEQSLTAWVQAEDDRVLLTLDPCGDDFTVPENAEYPEKWSMAAKDTSDSE